MKSFLFSCLLLAGFQLSYASHLRGGFISTQAISSGGLTQQVTLVLYLDEVTGQAATNISNSFLICFGDGTSATATRSARVFSSDRTASVNSYRVVHTYAGPGTYTLSFRTINRTAVQNIDRAELMPFSLATTFSIGSTENATPSPEFSRDTLTVNQRATVRLRASDADTDSLVYSLARPLTNPTAEGCSSPLGTVASYSFPNDLTQKGTFTLNSTTGVLTWDNPTIQGIFSVAITVSEYRRGILLSQTLEEITLLVVDRPGTPTPLPAYKPAVTGDYLITAIDEDQDEGIRLSAFPNPAQDQLQVSVTTNRSLPVTIQLIDLNGRTVRLVDRGRAARQHEQTIPVQDLSAGTYLLRATVGQRVLTRKILKR